MSTRSVQVTFPWTAAHDYNFLSVNAGRDVAIASNSDAVVGKVDGAFDAAVDEERLGSGDFALNDERTANRCLLRGGRWWSSLGRKCLRVWKIFAVRRLQHGGRPYLGFARL